MTVDFWTFSKRKNSTARPSGNPAYTFNCVLKDASGILRPVLEIYQSAAFNPSALNYARIIAYGRYYFVTDWEWIVGRWEVTLQVDTLASYKVQIGNAEKYVLRSAKKRNPNVIDTFYPSEAWAVEEEFTGTFNWTRSITAGHFVLGVVNRSQHLGMPVTYYDISASNLRKLMQIMFPAESLEWETALTFANQALIKSIYDPLQFVVSCKWFPCPISVDAYEYVGFGNWDGNMLSENQSEWIVGNPVSNPANWSGYLQVINVPSDWLNRPARERTAPNCHVFLKCNPWGVIDIDPIDLTRAEAIRLEAYPDYISGDCRLDVYAQITASSHTLIYQSNAKIGVDIPLANTAQNVGSFLNSLAGAIGAVASSGASAAAAVVGTLQALGSVQDAASSLQPSLSRAGGVMSGMVNLDGMGLLKIRTNYFVDENNDEFGKPLMETCVLNTLAADGTQSGFIKCADAEISLAAFPEEADEVSNYLTGGFYYE